MLLGNGDGTFQPAILFGSLYPAGWDIDGGVGLQVGDVNGDGLPDVVIAVNGTVTVFLNQTGIMPAKTSVTLSSGLNPAASGQAVVLKATVTAAGGSGAPTGTVTFMNGSSALGTAKLSGGTATWSTTGLAVGNESITASYAGNAHFAASSSSPLAQVINATPFTAAPTGNSSATVNAGQAAEFTVSFTPGTAMSQTVALSCSGGPPAATCTISPGSVILSGTSASSATVTIQTSSASAAAARPARPAANFGASVFGASRFPSSSGRSSSSSKWMGMVLGMMVVVVVCGGRRAGRRRAAFVGMVLAGLLLAGCGGASSGSSGSVGTQPTTYTVVVTAQSGNFSQQVNLKVTVQ